MFSTVSASTVEQSYLECGFGSTEIMTYASARDRIYWHKGKGILACIDIKEEKEVDYADTITGMKRSDTRLDLRQEDSSHFQGGYSSMPGQ